MTVTLTNLATKAATDYQARGRAAFDALDSGAQARLKRLAEIAQGVEAGTYGAEYDDCDMRRAAQMGGLMALVGLVLNDFGLNLRDIPAGTWTGADGTVWDLSRSYTDRQGRAWTWTGSWHVLGDGSREPVLQCGDKDEADSGLGRLVALFGVTVGGAK